MPVASPTASRRSCSTPWCPSTSRCRSLTLPPCRNQSIASSRPAARAPPAAIPSLISIGSGLTLFITESWQLILCWGVLVGLGAGSMALAFVATVTNRWFVKRKGLVTGVLTAGGAAGQLVFLPILAWLADHRSWQSVSITVSIAALTVVLYIPDASDRYTRAATPLVFGVYLIHDPLYELGFRRVHFERWFPQEMLQVFLLLLLTTTIVWFLRRTPLQRFL